jgi:nitrogen fixation NifU-like protein
MPLEEIRELGADWVIEQLGIDISPTRRKCALLSLKVMRGATTGDASWPE